MKNETTNLYYSFFLVQYFAQKGDVFRIDSLPTEGVLLDKNWKFHVGDNPDFAKVNFNDSAWTRIDPTKDIMDLTALPKSGEIVWFRLQLSLGEAFKNNNLALMLQQSGASEMYLNGQLIHQFGHISNNFRDIKAFDPLFKPFLFPNNKNSIQSVAIRYTLQPNILYTTLFEVKNPAVWAKLLYLDNGIEQYEQHVSRIKTFVFFLMGAFALLAILHLSFYIFINRLIIYICYSLSIPVAISFYLGVDFAFINSELTVKLKEVGDLSQKAIIQEQEKQQILASQNETLENKLHHALLNSISL